MGDRGVAEPGRHAPAGSADSAGRPAGDVVIRRTAAGWHVETGGNADPADELSDALTLADLLTGGAVPGPRPARPAGPQDELDRLRASVGQLEHALASRVLVEQAIGVLTERWHVPPRDAFEQLRRVTRSRGLRIHELARTVVDSCTDADIRLPAELAASPGSATPPQPRRSPDRADRADDGRSRQRQRGRRRGTGTPRPREPYGESPSREPGRPARTVPRPPRPAPQPPGGTTGAGGTATVPAGAAAVARSGTATVPAGAAAVARSGTATPAGTARAGSATRANGAARTGATGRTAPGATGSTVG